MLRYLLTIDEAIKFSKVFPQTFGALIEDKDVIRFKNAINSAPASLFHRVLNGSAAEFSSFRSWINPRLLKSGIVPTQKLFPHISSIIAMKDRAFESVSSSLNEWNVSLKAKDERVCSVSWTLVYRASLFGLGAEEFHHVPSCSEASR
jgi:hypothetical protein